MRGILAGLGYAFTDQEEKADFILFITCAVRESAEDRVYGLLGALKRLKETKPGLIIGLCGCMAQQESVVNKVRKSYQQVDLIFGTHAIAQLPVLLYRAMTEKGLVWDLSGEDGPPMEGGGIVRSHEWTASIPIMYGCNNFCTYCIVPYVRGRERSREPEAVLQEVRELADKGCREFLLLGQNVNSYGRGLTGSVTFAQLLQRINDVPGDFRVRFMTPHPKDASKELLDTILSCEKICSHLHLPVQSGSDRILKAMNRGYTAEQYLDIVRYVRSRSEDFSFSTDIIVGFPNETEEDFQQTLDLCREVRYDNIFSFIYSKRSGTKAALLEDAVSAQEKSDRMGRLLKLQREIASEHMRRFLGRRVRVLVEEEREPGLMSGKSGENIIVLGKGTPNLIGKWAAVEITEAYNWALAGKVLEEG